MARADDRADRVRYGRELELVVDRPEARFAAWYEMFPRSQGKAPGKSATFDDCIERLADVAALGFDVVYLVPIHPIGRVNRKGRDNAVVATPEDPGSPYAIGAAEGGHTAVNPELGTLDDFRRFVRAAAELGMEVALDFAIQCAPDHPWVRRAPGVVPIPPRRLDPLRREPAEEIRGHRQCRFLQPRPRGVVDGVARHRAVLDRPGGAHLPRRQPAHQAAAVLGVADPRSEGALPRGDLPVGGFHAAEDDAGAGQGRVHPVLHLFHLAQHKAGIDRIPDRTGPRPGEGIFPAQFLHQHARHPAGLSAGGRPAGVPHPAGAGGHAVAGLRHL